ncbi:hypothetical protein AFCA_000797 [Aspergillus flavus]|nr:hypothetical protein AFCA_000797 [Aspergillus flavus]
MKDIRGDDDAQLAAMGHKAELKRNFSLLPLRHWVMLQEDVGKRHTKPRDLGK